MYIVDHTCTVYKTMDYLAKKWTIMILLELFKRDEWKRFSEIKHGMKDLTPKILSERLKELIDHGLVENRIDSTSFPMKSEYRLTEKAIELMSIVGEIKTWALKWDVSNEACKNQSCVICLL